MRLERLKPGDKVKLNDAGVEVMGDFCSTRAQANAMLGLLTVEGVFDVEVTDDHGQLMQDYQSVDLVGCPAIFDNTQMEKQCGVGPGP